MARKRKRKSYHFDLGNSNQGPLGMCARITAHSKEEALARLRELTDGSTTDGYTVSLLDEGGEYIHIYVNSDNFSTDDIDEWEDEEDDSDPG